MTWLHRISPAAHASSDASNASLLILTVGVQFTTHCMAATCQQLLGYANGSILDAKHRCMTYVRVSAWVCMLKVACPNQQVSGESFLCQLMACHCLYTATASSTVINNGQRCETFASDTCCISRRVITSCTGSDCYQTKRLQASLHHCRINGVSSWLHSCNLADFYLCTAISCTESMIEFMLLYFMRLRIALCGVASCWGQLVCCQITAVACWSYTCVYNGQQ